MRKLKIVLTTLIALALVLTGVTVAIFASGEDVTEVSTADDLLAAWKDSSVSSIKLTADIYAGSGGYLKTAGNQSSFMSNYSNPNRDLTVDLGGYTIYFDAIAAQKGAFEIGHGITKDITVTFKNGTINGNRILIDSNLYTTTASTATIVLEDLTLSNSYNVAATDLSEDAITAVDANELVSLRSRNDQIGSVDLVMKGEVNFETARALPSGFVFLWDQADDDYQPSAVIDGAALNVSILEGDYRTALVAYTSNDLKSDATPIFTSSSGGAVVVKNGATVTSVGCALFRTNSNNGSYVPTITATDSTFDFGWDVLTFDACSFASLIVADRSGDYGIDATFTDCDISVGCWAVRGTWAGPPAAPYTRKENAYVEFNNCDISAKAAVGAVFYYQASGKINGGSVRGFNSPYGFGWGCVPYAENIGVDGDIDGICGVLVTGPVRVDKNYGGNLDMSTYGSDRRGQTVDFDGDLTTTDDQALTSNVYTYDASGNLLTSCELGGTSGTAYVDSSAAFIAAWKESNVTNIVLEDDITFVDDVISTNDRTVTIDLNGYDVISTSYNADGNGLIQWGYGTPGGCTLTVKGPGTFSRNGRIFDINHYCTDASAINLVFDGTEGPIVLTNGDDSTTPANGNQHFISFILRATGESGDVNLTFKGDIEFAASRRFSGGYVQVEDRSNGLYKANVDTSEATIISKTNDSKFISSGNVSDWVAMSSYDEKTHDLVTEYYELYGYNKYKFVKNFQGDTSIGNMVAGTLSGYLSIGKDGDNDYLKVTATSEITSNKYFEAPVFGVPNVKDEVSGKLVNDYKWVTFDFDISTADSTWPSMSFQTITRSIGVTETKAADGTVKRICTSRGGGTGHVISLSTAGVIKIGSYSTTINASGEWTHVTIACSIDQTNINNSILYLFVDGSLVGNLTGFDAGATLDAAAPNWTDNGDGTYQRSYTSTYFDSLRFWVYSANEGAEITW